jgi:membrane protein
MRREIQEDHLAQGAAALAFFWMLALFPAAIFLLTLLAYLPIQHLERALMHLVSDALPPDAASLFRGVVESTFSKRRGGFLSVGIILTAWSTSSGVHALMQQLNVAYDVTERRTYVRRRAVAIILSLTFLVLIIGAFVFIVVGRFIQMHLRHGAGADFVPAVIALRWIIIFVALLTGLAIVYRYGPSVRQRFRIISPGNVLAVLMLIATSVGFQLFVRWFGRFDVTYGSLAAVITLMLWLYLAGWAVLLGAELDATLASYKKKS